MQFDEFEFQLTRLERFFGKKIGHDQKDIWFEIIGHLPVDQCQKMVSRAIDGEKTFPTPKALKAYGDQEAHTLSPSQPSVECTACKSTGWISAARIHGPTQQFFVFRCRCPNGDRLSKKIQQWDNQVGYAP